MDPGLNDPIFMERQAKREVFLFFCITLAIQFAACFSVVWFSKQISAFLTALFHQQLPAFIVLYLGAFSPSLVGVSLALAGEKGAFRYLLRSLVRWRVGVVWWLVAVATIPGINLLADLCSRGLGFTHLPLNVNRYYYTLPMLLLSGFIFTDTGALGEEIGWRGYGLPRLLRLLSPLNASIVLGVVWALWHVPGWFIPELHFAQKNFVVFLANCVLVSILMTHTYIRAKNSALVGGIVWHLMANATGDAKIGTNDIRTAVLLLLAVCIVVWVDRQRMLANPVEAKSDFSLRTRSEPANSAKTQEISSQH